MFSVSFTMLENRQNIRKESGKNCLGHSQIMPDMKCPTAIVKQNPNTQVAITKVLVLKFSIIALYLWTLVFKKNLLVQRKAINEMMANALN